MTSSKGFRLNTFTTSGRSRHFVFTVRSPAKATKCSSINTTQVMYQCKHMRWCSVSDCDKPVFTNDFMPRLSTLDKPPGWTVGLFSPKWNRHVSTVQDLPFPETLWLDKEKVKTRHHKTYTMCEEVETKSKCGTLRELLHFMKQKRATAIKKFNIE